MPPPFFNFPPFFAPGRGPGGRDCILGAFLAAHSCQICQCVRLLLSSAFRAIFNGLQTEAQRRGELLEAPGDDSRMKTECTNHGIQVRANSYSRGLEMGAR